MITFEEEDDTKVPPPSFKQYVCLDHDFPPVSLTHKVDVIEGSIRRVEIQQDWAGLECVWIPVDSIPRFIEALKLVAKDQTVPKEIRFLDGYTEVE